MELFRYKRMSAHGVTRTLTQGNKGGKFHASAPQLVSARIRASMVESQ